MTNPQTAPNVPDVTPAVPEIETDHEAGLEGAASFADAESREILNLLGDQAAGSACCGGSCCA